MIIKRGKEMKRQRSGTWVLFVIFGLSAFVALLMFSGNPRLTGNVVVGEYTDQTTCEAANFTWEELTENQCAEGCVSEITQVLCAEGCVVEYTEVLCESGCQEAGNCTVGCVDAYTQVLCAEGCVSEITQVLCEPGCEDIVIGGQCVNNTCIESWTCTDWAGCDGATETRTCTDANVCGTTETKPIESQSCTLCTPDWTNEDWSECSNGEKTRSPSDNNDCNIDYPGALTATCTESSTSTTTSTTTTTTTENTESTTTGEVTITSYPVCTPGQESCANGALYVCNGDGTGWDARGDCPSETIATTETVAESCEDGLKNQDEKGVDCGGVCTKKCSFFTLAGSVVQGPVSNVTAFFNANKTRAYLIIGGVGVLVAGFVAFMVFKKKILSLIKK